MIASTYFNECNATFPCALDPMNLMPMRLASNDWNSLYIPILPNHLFLRNSMGESHKFHLKYVSYFFEKLLQIGKVGRVDFIDRNLVNGQTPVKAAFIHFDYWYNNQNARNMRDTLNNAGSGRISGYEHAPSRMHCGFQIHNRPGYFDVKINHKPIESSECDRNVYQLREDNRVLELELISKNKEIAELERKLANAISMCQPVYHHNLHVDVQSTDMNKTIYPQYHDDSALTMADLEIP